MRELMTTKGAAFSGPSVAPDSVLIWRIEDQNGNGAGVTGFGQVHYWTHLAAIVS